MNKLIYSFLTAAACAFALPAMVYGIGENNPGGVTINFEGAVTTAGSTDFFTGNAKRVVDDIKVEGAVGAYPLKWTRTLDTRRRDGAFTGGWAHSYVWHLLVREPGAPTIPTGPPGGCGDDCPDYDEVDAQIIMPDGASYNLYKSLPGQFTSMEYSIKSGFIGVVKVGPGVYEALMTDGGRARFTGTANADHIFMSFASSIIDPYGQVTTLAYEASNLVRVTEPAGRYLQINRENGKITNVQAFDGRGNLTQTVSYDYSTLNLPRSYGPAPYLTRVNYDDGTHASYTYQSPNVVDVPLAEGPGLIKTCDDPRFDGVMKQIEYEFVFGTNNPPFAWGQVKAEKNFTTHEVVSQISYPSYPGVNPPTDLGQYRRTETRGDGAVRYLQYGGIYGAGSLADYSDFKEQWSHITTGETFTNARGYRTIAERNGAYKVAKLSHPDDSIPSFATYEYPDLFYLSASTDENGKKTYHDRDESHRVWRIRYPDSSFELFQDYNQFNQFQTHQLTSGAVEHFQYDERGLLRISWNSVEGYEDRKEYDYDQRDRLWTVQDGQARSVGKPFSTRMTYNGQDKVLTLEYCNNQPEPNGKSWGSDVSYEPEPNPTVTYQYDDYGNCTSVTDELGHRRTYEYDAYGRCIAYTEPLSSDANGTVLSSRTWNWFYDRYFEGVGWRSATGHTANEWRLEIEPAFNVDGTRRMRARIHDANDQLAMEISAITVTTPVTEQWANSCRPTSAQSSGSGWSAAPDGQSRVYTYNETGQKKTYTDPLGKLTTYEYDSRDRLWEMFEPINPEESSHLTTTLYDGVGNKTKVTFPDQRVQEWTEYDGFGQPKHFKDERGNLTDFTYKWGPMKKLETVTTHREIEGGGSEAQVTTYEPDGLGRLGKVIFPDTSFEQTTYRHHRVSSWRTRKGSTKTLQYDFRGREISHLWDDNTPGVTTGWDDADRIVSAWNIYSSIDFTYDDADQVMIEGNHLAGTSRTQLSYLRYPNGAIWAMIYPSISNLVFPRAYTARGQLERVLAPLSANSLDFERMTGPVLAGYTYRADGKVDHQDARNGIRTSYGYDERAMIKTVEHTRQAPLQLYTKRTYVRDERDRILSWSKSNSPAFNPLENGRGDYYLYDPEGQLTNAWHEALPPVDPPVITTQPVSQTVTVNQSATFSVAASGANLTYQWKKGVTAISGANGASYTTPATSLADNGSKFSVVVSNAGGGVTSNEAVLEVTPSTPPAPVITTQPASQTVTVNQSATFSVTASGASLTYQWRKGVTAISGANGASYTTPATSLADNGSKFSVVVSNAGGTVTSNEATLGVNSGTPAAPVITTHPASQTVTVSQSATFSVTANGANLAYQWKKGVTAISGATGASYITPATSLADNGSKFSVVVSNAGGSVTSNEATLGVTPPPPVDPVVITPDYENLQLTMTCNTPGATIRYSYGTQNYVTLGPNSSVYSVPLPINCARRYYSAYASKAGMADSGVSQRVVQPDCQPDGAEGEGAEAEGVPVGASRVEAFFYDALGNRKGNNTLPNRGSNVRFEQNLKKLNQYGGWGIVPVAPIAYDDNGATTSEGSYSATFNALNQLVSISRGGSGTTWFAYDPLGRCIKRWSGASAAPGSNPASYFYYGGWNLIEETTGGSNIVRLYVHGGRVDEIVAESTWLNSAPFNYHHYDGQGNCILLTGSDGTMKEQYSYDAFGKPYFYTAANNWGTDVGQTSFGNRFLFQGREWLADLQLYDFRHRLYHPELGRFIQPDPKQFDAGDYNLYRFCHNDPVNKSDPMGLLWAFSDKKLEADFNKVRQAFNNNPTVKAMFDRIANDKEHTVTVNRSSSISRDRDQIKITNKGNSSFSWNPRAAIAFDGGRQSPATVFVHEAAHADRARTDPMGTANALRAGDGPMGRVGRFGNLDDRRIILGPEAAAAKTMSGEAARSDAKGTFYEVDSVTDH